ncbi:hypothetical protein [Cupriavidus oxalaticus]|uniref:Uncharacterized protein n=1 Tax=Cupriavidus oxalaticus TaxID=96344 RepID=A0A4P7LIJ5_9BURK|nr:hypothetical protein [Cupriavidus oxalaticus]QBY56054.1 hypothetical protein E0W60_33915 [Cupriavidus oxalaticus]
MLTTDIYAADTPRVYQDFAALVGEKSWRKPAEDLLSHTRRSPFLREHYRRTHAITFAMQQCSTLAHRHGVLLPHRVSEHGLERAVAFMAQVVSLHAGLSAPMRPRFLARVRNALRKSEEMRGLQLELSAATHFARQGRAVRWPELEPDAPAMAGATYDLLVEDLGSAGLEVECKAVSHDKGRVLVRESLTAFSEALRHVCGAVSHDLRGGLMVVVTVPDQLPASSQDQQALARDIHAAVLANQSQTRDDGVQVRIEAFDMAALRDVDLIHDGAAARAVAEALTGTRNRHVVVMGRRNRGALLIVVQSARADSLRDAIQATLRTARRQLTGHRPGMVLLGFDGIEAEQLMQIARQDHTPGLPPTVLALAASAALGGPDREHLVCVGFLSNTHQRECDDQGRLAYTGAAYHFTNRHSPYWHVDFGLMFGGAQGQPGASTQNTRAA